VNEPGPEAAAKQSTMGGLHAVPVEQMRQVFVDHVREAAGRV